MRAPSPGARILTMLTVGRTLLAFGSVSKGAARAPAAWTTTDLAHWTRVGGRPATGYGEVAQWVMASDAEGRVVAYGQAFGGAHSNPRPTTWAGSTRLLTEHEQPYTLFGGEDAIGVTAMTSHGPIVLISGAWDGPDGYGAAVWLTRDGIRWTRIADAAGLASTRGEQTFASGATAAEDGFHLAGSTMAGGRTMPLAWRSTDGTAWTRIALSSATPAESARASACDASGCTVIGSTLETSQRLRCWRLRPDGAEAASSTGPGAGLVDIGQALIADGAVFVVGAVDHVATLWTVGRDCTDWRAVPSPEKTEGVTAVSFGGHVVLATTTPERSSLWISPAP